MLTNVKQLQEGDLNIRDLCLALLDHKVTFTLISNPGFGVVFFPVMPQCSAMHRKLNYDGCVLMSL